MCAEVTRTSYVIVFAIDSDGIYKRVSIKKTIFVRLQSMTETFSCLPEVQLLAG